VETKNFDLKHPRPLLLTPLSPFKTRLMRHNEAQQVNENIVVEGMDQIQEGEMMDQMHNEERMEMMVEEVGHVINEPQLALDEQMDVAEDDLAVQNNVPENDFAVPNNVEEPINDSQAISITSQNEVC
jgi:hypothetical protein